MADMPFDEGVWEHDERVRAVLDLDNRRGPDGPLGQNRGANCHSAILIVVLAKADGIAE